MSASPRKHNRQMPNLRRYPRGRPQILHRLCLRVENLGFLASFTLFAVVAILSLAISSIRYGRNGMPMCRSSARAGLSLFAVVTTVTFIPFSLSTLA